MFTKQQLTQGLPVLTPAMVCETVAAIEALEFAVARRVTADELAAIAEEAAFAAQAKTLGLAAVRFDDGWLVYDALTNGTHAFDEHGMIVPVAA